MNHLPVANDRVTPKGGMDSLSKNEKSDFRFSYKINLLSRSISSAHACDAGMSDLIRASIKEALIKSWLF